MGYRAGAYLSVWDIATATVAFDLASDPIDIGAGDFGGFANGSAGVELVELSGGSYIYALSERNGCARYSVSAVITVDGVGAGAYEYATLQGAIDSYCAGAANAGVTDTPLIIQVDPAGGPYDESMTLNDTATGNGDIVGDLVIKSTTDAAKPVIKLQLGISGGADGIYIYQNVYNLIFKDLVFCPSQSGTTVTDDLLKIDENSANSVLNWVEFYGCVVTDIDEAGDPMVLTKAEALVEPATSGSTLGAGDYLIKSWGDAGEGRCVFMDDSIVYGGPSYGAALYMAGAGNEKVFVNNSMFAWNGYPGLLAGSYSGATGTKNVRVTGTDAGAGYEQCTCSYENEWHATYYPGATDGVVKIDNLLAYNTSAGDTGGTGRGISGSGWNDLQVSDSIIDVNAVCVVDGLTNYAQYPPFYKNCTFNSTGGVLFSISSSATLTVEDCILSGAGSTSFTGTLTQGVLVNNCGVVKQGASAISSIGTATETNSIYIDPLYASMDPTSSAFFDVTSKGYAGAGVSGGDVAGGADFIGGYDSALGDLMITEVMDRPTFRWQPEIRGSYRC